MRTHLRLALAASVLALVMAALPAARAAAQPSTGTGPTEPGAHRLTFELDFFHQGSSILSPSVTLLAPAAYARFRVVDSRHDLDRESGAGGFVMDLDIAWRGAGLAGDTSTFRMGNPYVGFRAGTDSGPFTVRGGLGITLPLTNLYEDGLSDSLGYALAYAVHGVWDIHLIAPQSMALVVRADAEYRTDFFLVGAEGAFVPLFSVPSDGRDAGNPSVTLQLGVFGAVMPIPALAAGLRFQMVGIFSDGRDDAQLALVPFVRGDLGPVFLEGRLYMNLDEPFGFAFDEGKFWAISLTVGADF